MKTKGNLKEKQGISLIVLVITIIVIIILAVAVILSIANNNPISNANKAKFQNDLKSIQEELDLYNASEYTNSHTKGTTYVPATLDNLSSATKYKDSGKLVIQDGNLYVDASKLSNDELAWANEIGITEAPVVYSELNIPSTAISAETAIDGLYIDKNNGNEITGKYTGISKNLKLANWEQGYNMSCFEGNDYVERIIIPKNFSLNLYQGDGVFGNFTNLKEVTFEEGSYCIEQSMFSGCKKLQKVNLPEGLKEINMYAFVNCESLTQLVIPDSVTKLGADAFRGCINLTVTMTESLAKNNLRDDLTKENMIMFWGAKDIIFK